MCALTPENQNETLQNSSSTRIIPKYDIFYFPDSFFNIQLNLENENRLEP